LNYGEQALYTVVVRLMQDGSVMDQCERRIGLRRLRLLQHAFEDQPGSAFCFEVNNTPIFCGGANWIPADSLLSRITADRYRRWLQLAADANMTMLRVWGGGIYEEDVFYDTCDELGLLVWQDFMFACALYPAHEEFQKSVGAEVEANVRRLRNHPSLVLWCGNNEDYMHSYPMGLYDANFQGDFATTRFPAREIYERLLPAICGQLDPTRPYWPGSPYGGVNANEMLRGDQHIWDIWHGSMSSYHDYARYPGRFVSEFGMQALPQRSTLELCAEPEELYPLSRTLEHHNKAPDGSRRLAVYLSDTVHLPGDLDEYIYATQFVQAEAVATGLRGWRRQFAGPGREYTAGALVWQINDCWPVTSWALVDSELQAKPAYYLTRRVLAPVTVELAKASPSQAVIWAVNGRMVPVEVELEVRRWLLDGTLIDEQRRVLLLPPNQSIELGQRAYCSQDRQIISARLIQQDKTIARAALWPEPFKHLTLPDPEITIEWLDAQTLQIGTRRPAKGLWLSSSQPVQWSDNMLDLLPGDSHVVTGLGLEKAKLMFRWLH
jgi:beta-mannosidase